MNVSSPVTGGAQTGFTSPTYTLTQDTAPSLNSKQWAVTALGGTQTGVTIHSPASPFTVTIVKPVVTKVLPIGSSTDSVSTRVPMNEYEILVRKGGTPAANWSDSINIVRLTFGARAGVDTYDPSELRAMVSLAIGTASQLSAGIGDTLTSGIF